MRVYWTEEEESDLRFFYEDIGLSLSEIHDEFIKKYP